jgi:hypothetical protein
VASVVLRGLRGGALSCGAVVIAGAMSGCVSTREMMADAVRERATQDLVCDLGSVKTRSIGVVTRTKSERQGFVERATWAAEGCGGSEVYTVECMRGVCFAVQDKPIHKRERTLYDERPEP